MKVVLASFTDVDAVNMAASFTEGGGYALRPIVGDGNLAVCDEAAVAGYFILRILSELKST